MVAAPPNCRGLSLVELLIGMVVFAVLVGLALPSYRTWLQNAQIRAAAESVLNGLQFAKVEAVRRNTQVRFQLPSSTGTTEWTVGCVSASATCPATIQSRPAQEGSANAQAGVSTAALSSQDFDTALTAGAGMPASVTFNGLGRVVNIGSDLTRVDVVSAVLTPAEGMRRLVIMVAAGGLIRLCRPDITLSSNPQSCSS